jgi:CheY-like chemotaxis protein
LVDSLEILLADDNEGDRELAVHVLKKTRMGHKIHCVKDGAEALEFLFATGSYENRQDKGAPCVILLDLKMPKVDGLEVLRQVKNDERTKSIPVVMLTSSREERDLVESYKRGVNSFVVKPVDYDQFAETMKDVGRYWIRRNQPPPQAPCERGFDNG